MEAYHILIVEDDKEIREGIEIYLKNQGYVVFQAADGVEGLEVIGQEEIHLAIVDVMMPRMDGITMMMKVREMGKEFPVIMLSAKSEEVDKIMGLNMGADDYVTKPFHIAVLESRIAAVLRRAPEEADALISCGRISLDRERMRVQAEGKEVVLTALEYRLLLVLMENKGRTLPRSLILEKLWDSEGNYVNDNTLTVTVKRLREKLKNTRCIATVRGIGYRMEEAEDETRR